MSTATPEDPGDDHRESRIVVDPRAPRVGQGITASLLAIGILLQVPALVFLVAVFLLLPVVTQWRVDPYRVVWKHLLAPRVAPPTERDDPTPHRFTKLIGASITTLASIALLAGFPVPGYALAGIVAVLAGIAATTGFCLGCRMYEEVAFVRRLGIV